ncbi:PPE domain-containing protein [[Mycobacterium] wendilense]|uniref:PPE domain-containing protein n=1 Tax=[Mycobacterium] wendilense TaxID=3064284 RepID=A0ABN9NVZ5_9MYCO|nr:PPE domain-containing protein [Mycolicibacterium sp. MU0050]CAJ1578397.1 PPE domain-containing protein [Mycolicibacterium sp. MU0050]
MIDPGWALRTPEQNDLLLKAAPGGLPSMSAALAAYTAEMASTEAAAGMSTANMVGLNAGFQGAASLASTATTTGLNTVAHLLFGWLAEKPPIISTAVSAFTTAYSTMVPAALCITNREEWAMYCALNAVIPVFGIPIAERDLEYYGGFWPNNARTGATYAATLTSLMPALAIPPPLTPQNAAPAMPAAAATAVAETAATTAAGDAMRASSEAAGQVASTGSNGAGSFMDVAQQALGPAQKAFETVPKAFEGILGAPTSFMQPAMSAVQGLTGMFGGSMGGANAASAAEAIRPTGAGGVPGAGLGALSGGGGGGGAAAPGSAQGLTSYVRPSSGFAPENGGRATGLRTPGLLPAGDMRAPAMAAGGGAMPLGPAGMLARSQDEGGQEQVTRARIVTEGDRTDRD